MLNKKLEGSQTTSISQRGFEFDLFADTWRLNRNITTNTGFLSQFDSECREDIREALAYYAEVYSPGYTKNTALELKRYLKLTQEVTFTELGLLTYKGKTPKNKQHLVSTLRTFLRQMRDLQLHSTISGEVYTLLDSWRIPSNDKGIPVLSLDPLTGPFSDTEFEAIGHRAAHKYAEGVLSSKEYSVILSFKATGRRLDQIASLKIKDLIYTNKLTGSHEYILLIPRSKQRNGKFRSSYRAFGLIDDIGRVLSQYIKEHISNIEKVLGYSLTNEQKNELPLFMESFAYREARETLQSIPQSELLETLKTELLHIKNNSLSTFLQDCVDTLRITSERTGKALHANSYRFRYTLGTRAAREGAGTQTIAQLLDHSDEQHVGVYVENIPEFALEISKIMNQSLAPYAAAFTGQVIKDEKHAAPNATRISCQEKDCDVGSCGTNAFCTDYAPIACYLCPKFQPWANAPHHLVLKWLMEERERLKKDTGGDMNIVAINDRAIIAVCQVMKLCKESNDE